jgi:AcrR family transcriptional regulator
VSLVAMRLFDTSGYDGTSMDDIAVAAGVSRRSLFRYFPVKAALIWDGFDPFFRVLDGRLESSPIDRDVASAIERCVVQSLLALGDDLRLARIRLRILSSHPELRSFGSAGLLAVRDRLGRFVAERLQLPPRSLEAAALADAATAAMFAALRYWAVDTTDETPVNCVHRAMNALAGVFGSR